MVIGIARIPFLTRFPGLVADFVVHAVHNPFGEYSADGLIVRQVRIDPRTAALNLAGGLL